jgi:hypothetical protein
MSETALLALLALAGSLLSGIVGHTLGQRAERSRQAVAARVALLAPIEEWLSGASKLVGILGDTLSTVSLGLPGPLSYDFPERLATTKFMGEHTNITLGIMSSEALSTRHTRWLARHLASVVDEIDQLLKYQLLPIESEILERGTNKRLDEPFVLKVGSLKLRLDALLKDAHSTIARIRTELS